MTASVEKYFSTDEKRNFVSPSGHVMFCLLYKHQRNTISLQKARFIM